MAELRILVVDNRDSFVYNLVRYLEELGAEPIVHDAQDAKLFELDAAGADALLVSPGPYDPDHAGISLAAIQHFAGKMPILGVCLGHQAIGQAFGWRVTRSGAPTYGRAAEIRHDDAGLFAGLPNPLQVGLYHSLTVEPAPGAPLKIDARAPNGEVMALSHAALPIYGVQFHPESILSQSGHALLDRFLDIVRQQ